MIRIKLFAFALFICSLSCPFSFCQADDSSIKEVNAAVKQIQSKKSQFETIEVKLQTETLEGVPPQMRFYYDGKTAKPQILEVSVGHEVFLIQFTYFFRDGKVIKYLKTFDGHPQNPPKEAIIYDAKGSVLWKNTDRPVFPAEKIESLFNDLWKSLQAFSKL